MLSPVGCGEARDDATAAIGEGAEPSSTAILAVPDGLTRCPFTDAGRSPNASSWGGSVAEVSCAEAGTLIQERFNHDFPRSLERARAWPSDAESIQDLDPFSFDSAGLHCVAFPLPDGMGWHLLCGDGVRAVSYYFTP